MTEHQSRIPFEEFALNLRDLFDRLAEKHKPVLVEHEGQVFRLQIEEVEKPEDIWAGYDPQQAHAALRKSAGALQGIDRTQLITDIHQARRQNSQGRLA